MDFVQLPVVREFHGWRKLDFFLSSMVEERVVASGSLGEVLNVFPGYLFRLASPCLFPETYIKFDCVQRWPKI